MNKLTDQRIILLMEIFRVERTCFINPEVKAAYEDYILSSYNFIPKQGVKGLVIFGKKYPFSNRDIDIEEHIKFFNFYKSVKGYGVIFEDSQNSNLSSYLDNELNVYKDQSLEGPYYPVKENKPENETKRNPGR